MEWSSLYPADTSPSMEEIGASVASPLWDELCAHIEETYGLKRFIEYSKCSMARGWNVKFRKSGRNLCTLYPEEGGFTCLIVEGDRELMELELLLPSCTDYVRELFERTPSAMGGLWLMVEVTTPEILEDVKDLLRIRWNAGQKG